MEKNAPSSATNRTHIAKVSVDRIEVRGRDLVNELMGRCSYTEMVFFLLRNRMPEARETRMLDACLVTLMEHGLTPSALISRLAINSVPGEIQIAMSAGLLTVGNVFAGTMEGCALLLQAGVQSALPPEEFCRETVREHRARKAPIPGFGHAIHKPDDPRTPRLLELARECGLAGPHVELLLVLAAEIDRAAGKHITINATGMIGAVLLELGLRPDVMRGLAVVSRAGGLLGHIQEERDTDSTRTVRQLVAQHIPYERDDGDNNDAATAP